MNKELAAKKAEYYSMVATGRPVEHAINTSGGAHYPDGGLIWTEKEPNWICSPDVYLFRFKEIPKKITIELTREQMMLVLLAVGYIKPSDIINGLTWSPGETLPKVLNHLGYSVRDIKNFDPNNLSSLLYGAYEKLLGKIPEAK